MCVNPTYVYGVYVGECLGLYHIFLFSNIVTTLVRWMPHTVYTPFSLMLLSISAHPFFCYPATRRMKGERIQEDIATYLCKWTMSTFICSQSWFMFVSISEQQNDQQIVRVLKQHKIPLGFGLLAMRCSDETAAVLCCNQRNEYTIPIVTLTCNHARDRQFRTTRTAI